MTCPLCRSRKARRGCPALGQQICAVCCGTKRLAEIACPPDCAWLAGAREHPPAVVVRQQRHDYNLIVPQLRDLTERQAQLFLYVASAVAAFRPDSLQQLIDDDVADAADALAATHETAARGVIYEQRPAGAPAEQLCAVLKPLLAEAGKGLGSSFDRDAAVVLRRIADAARGARGKDAGDRRAFIELAARVLRRGSESPAPEPPPEAPRLIVP